MVLLTHNWEVTCPCTILQLYGNQAVDVIISWSSIFQYGAVLSYTRTRELVLQALTSLGYEKKKFGLVAVGRSLNIIFLQTPHGDVN